MGLVRQSRHPMDCHCHRCSVSLNAPAPTTAFAPADCHHCCCTLCTPSAISTARAHRASHGLQQPLPAVYHLPTTSPSRWYPPTTSSSTSSLLLSCTADLRWMSFSGASALSLRYRKFSGCYGNAGADAAGVSSSMHGSGRCSCSQGRCAAALAVLQGESDKGRPTFACP